MDNQDTTLSQQLADHIRIQDLQGRWRRVSHLSIADFEQLWNDTTSEIRKSPSGEESIDEDDLTATF